MSSERDAERRVPFNGRVVVDLESDAYDHIFTDTPPHRRRVASVYGRDAEVANRLAACWNACIGMEDPEADLLAVSGERDRLRTIAQRAFKIAADLYWSNASDEWVDKVNAGKRLEALEKEEPGIDDPPSS